MTEDQHIHDPEVDIDPNEAIELDYDEETDTEGQPDNDQIDEDFEPVEGATPLDDEWEDLDLEPAESEIPEGED